MDLAPSSSVSYHFGPCTPVSIHSAPLLSPVASPSASLLASFNNSVSGMPGGPLLPKIGSVLPGMPDTLLNGRLRTCSMKSLILLFLCLCLVACANAATPKSSEVYSKRIVGKWMTRNRIVTFHADGSWGDNGTKTRRKALADAIGALRATSSSSLFLPIMAWELRFTWKRKYMPLLRSPHRASPLRPTMALNKNTIAGPEQ